MFASLKARRVRAASSSLSSTRSSVCEPFSMSPAWPIEGPEVHVLVARSLPQNLEQLIAEACERQRALAVVRYDTRDVAHLREALDRLGVTADDVERHPPDVLLHLRDGMARLVVAQDDDEGCRLVG